jgi:hypothetical protein
MNQFKTDISMNQHIQTTKCLLTLLIILFCDVLVMAQVKTPINIGETQDVPNVMLPIHDLLINQDANDAEASITQTISLAQGWNWFSPYVKAEDPVDMLVMLEEGLGENANMILSMEDGMTEYDGEEWFGDLDDVGLANTQMYMVLANAACTVEMEGVPANLTDYEITIKPGWNWIGFPSTEALNVTNALADFAAEEGDIILSQDDGMTEYDGEDWFGDLETFEPGVGLMYFNSSDETKTLVYSTAAKVWEKRKK